MCVILCILALLISQVLPITGIATAASGESSGIVRRTDPSEMADIVGGRYVPLYSDVAPVDADVQAGAPAEAEVAPGSGVQVAVRVEAFRLVRADFGPTHVPPTCP